MAARTCRRKPAEFHLRLYIAGGTPKSAIALSNLQQLCERYLAGRYLLEVIDLAKNPALAKADQILAVPTLVRIMPIPLRRAIGTLADTARVLAQFGVASDAAALPLFPKGAARA